MHRGAPDVVLPQDARHLRVTPSVIGLSGGSGGTPPHHAVGNIAKGQAKTNPTYTFMGLKRLLGRRFDDQFVQRFAETMPFKLTEGPNGEAWLVGPDRKYSPEELLGDVLTKVREDAQIRTGEIIGHAVIAKPAHFTKKQEACIVDAAKLAGLKVLQVIAEPTAAALAYAIDREDKSVIAVFDFGGGTFDVSILKVRGRQFEKLGAAGDAFLGGMDFDGRLVKWMVTEFIKEHGIDPSDPLQNPTASIAMQRFWDAAELAKIALSSVRSHTIDLGWLARAPKTGENLGFQRTITVEFLVDLCADLIDRTIEPCKQAMEDARKALFAPALKIDEVVLVGGMTQMPAIREVVEQIFGRAPRTDINPDEAVAFGCAIMGAALQSATRGVSLNERTTTEYGIEDADGEIFKMIPRNAKMPAEKAITFTTANDNQRKIVCRIFEGNRQVGWMILEGIRPAPAGVPQIEVRFVIDYDGVLTVKATDLDAERPAEVSAKIHTASGLTDADLEELRMMWDI